MFEWLPAPVHESGVRRQVVEFLPETDERRRSACDALADVSLNVAELRQMLAHSLPDSATLDERQVWVIGGTNWRRPATRANADRAWEYQPLPGWAQSGTASVLLGSRQSAFCRQIRLDFSRAR